MSLKSFCFAGALALFPFVASAQMMVEDSYARSASAVAVSGAAFLHIMNPSEIDDRLIGASSEVAERVELHTHMQDDAGVMRMVHVEEGFEIPSGEALMMQRGGIHVMLLGLRQPLTQGDEFELTLEFETAEPVTVTVPVDLERQPAHGGMGHGHMNHGSDS